MQPQIKGLVNDIVNKYLNYINTDELKNPLFNLLNKQYNEGLLSGELKFNMNFLPDYRTVSFIQNFAFSNIKGLNEELKEKLRKEMSIGLMNRETIPQLKLRILDVMDTIISRAEMITKTEANRAFNMGHFQAAKDSGLNMRKQWSSQSERTSKAGNLVPCPQCNSMDGVIIDMNSKFKFNDGEELDLPPKHPNCACRVLYIQSNI